MADMRQLSIVVLVALASATLGGQALTQVRPAADPDSVHWRNDCRQAAQTIRTGSPRARVQEALGLARICDGEARQLLIERWTAVMSDAQGSDSAWREVSMLVEGLQDGRLLQSALNLTENESLTLAARTWAMSVAFSQLRPHEVLDPFNLRSIPVGHLCGGPDYLHGVDRVQGEPLPGDAIQQVIDASERIVSVAGRESAVGRAADCLWRSATVVARRP